MEEKVKIKPKSKTLLFQGVRFRCVEPIGWSPSNDLSPMIYQRDGCWWHRITSSLIEDLSLVMNDEGKHHDAFSFPVYSLAVKEECIDGDDESNVELNQIEILSLGIKSERINKQISVLISSQEQPCQSKFTTLT